MANQYELRPGETTQQYYARLPGSAPGSAVTGISRNARSEPFRTAPGGATVMSQGSTGAATVMPAYIPPASQVPPGAAYSSSAGAISPAVNAGQIINPISTPQNGSAPTTPGTTYTPGSASTANVPPNRYYTDQDVINAQRGRYATQNPAEAAKSYQQEALKLAQQQIDSINEGYKLKLESELGAVRPEQEQAMGRTNALSALMGLAGSSSADTRAGAQGARNAEQNRLITSKVTAEKIAALNAIYGKIDDRSAEVYKAQLETNKENQDRLLKDVAANALNDLQSIAVQVAETGVTFEDWKTKNPEYYKKMQEQGNLSDYQMMKTWEDSLPADLKPATQTTYQDDGKGGTIMKRFSYNPVTGKTSLIDVPINAPISMFNSNEKPIEVGDKLLVRQADGTYKDVAPKSAMDEAEIALKKSQAAKNYADAAQGGKTTTQITDENYDSAKQEAVGLFQADAAKNADQKVSPALFEAARNRIPSSKKDDFDKWARDAGYLSSETMKQFGIVPKSDSVSDLMNELNSVDWSKLKG